MSLIDSFLLEPPPLVSLTTGGREIWIALRNDLQLGSDKLDDPHDGSSIVEPEKVITEIVGLAVVTIAEATCVGHGCQTGDIITVTVELPGTAPYLDGFEASDFTIDCNGDGQPVASGYSPAHFGVPAGARTNPNVVRNCYIDCQYRADPREISTLTDLVVPTTTEDGKTLPGTAEGTFGVNVDRTESAWAANNVFTMQVNTAMRFVQSRAVVHGGNLGPTFSPIDPKRSNTPIETLTPYPELYDEFDDAFLLGF